MRELGDRRCGDENMRLWKVQTEKRMALKCIADVSHAPDQFCYFVSSTFFVHNVSSYISYDLNLALIRKRKRQRYRGRCACTLMKLRRKVNNLPLPSVLLANVHQSLENKLDELRLKLSYQRDLRNCNILCFSETRLNKDTDHILAGFSMHRQDRAAAPVKLSGCVSYW
jgi:hypothetical protein